MKRYALFFLCAVAIGSGRAGQAQDAPVVDEEARAKRLANEKAELEIEEARRALSAAKRKDIVDSIPTGDTTGKTEVKGDAGKMEASALAALAINALADDIARDALAAANASAGERMTLPAQTSCPKLRDLDGPAGPTGQAAPVVLTASSEKLSFQQWSYFRFRACLIAGQFVGAINDADAVLGARSAGSGEGGGGAAGIGAALTAVSKLAQLVTPDYEVGGITLTPSDRALLTAVAREYLSAAKTIGGRQGPLYWSSEVSRIGGAEHVFTALEALDRQDQAAATLITQLKSEKKVRQAKRATEALQAARTAYAGLLTQLGGKDDESPMPLAKVLSQAAVARLLGPRGLVLSANVQTAGGGYYTRRVIWNALALGGPPFYVSGGVVVNFAAIRASDQQVMAAGQFACDAGYVRLDRVRRMVNVDNAKKVKCTPFALPYELR